ncbi:MAG: glycoside hydrolase family 2 [Opitutae bacterium]|nr:glycoside hydrolase family 2 [Opitutae bacterium]
MSPCAPAFASRFWRLLFASAACLAAGLTASPLARAAAPDDLAWPAVQREHKPWTRWWWPGSAVDPANLTRELTALAEAGLGGVEITPIYGAKGAEERFVPFLSPKYVELLAHTAAEARRLGLGVDMATGTGWPFGGPQVGPDDAELKIALADGQLAPRPTGFKVKRAAPGGAGPVLNPFSPAALARYLVPFTAALAPLPPGALHGQFHDSFEYTANWTPELPEKFLAQHGYDLRDRLAEFGGAGDPEIVARVKSDYRETLAQLHLDYVKTWVEWTHRLGGVARNQAHGAPGNLLDLYAAADIPETEVFGASAFPLPGYRYEAAELGKNLPQPLVNRFASSAAHVAGRPHASSETFTWLREHFHESPSEMKPELDQLFLTGINHVFYHGTAYSPADAPWPGWLFYASTQFNPRNPLWRDFAALNAYIARAQSLLQAGAPDNDLLVYWPVYDLWHRAEGWDRRFSMHGRDWLTESPTGETARLLIARGCAFDFISDAQLDQTRFAAGELKTPGAAYRAILVPRCEHLPLATLQRLLALAHDGATVLFLGALPADVPGLGRLAERRAQFQAALAPLAWADGPTAGLRIAPVGEGQMAVGPSLTALLALTRATAEPLATQGVDVLRRRTADGYIYFVANLTAQPLDGWVQLGRAAQSAVLLDARTGRAGVAALHPLPDGAEVFLQLRPGESIFVRTLTKRAARGAAWPYFCENEDATPIALAGEWRVRFSAGGPELPPAFATPTLHSWTEQGGEAERFAGTARYELDFTLPAGAKADDWLLSLGDVRETARVFINGTEVDHLWSLPFVTRLGPTLRPGRNQLAIEVTNLAANRIRDLDRRGVAWKNFHEINFVNIHYKSFDAAEWPLQPSGLLGPVTLTPLRTLKP